MDLRYTFVIINEVNLPFDAKEPFASINNEMFVEFGISSSQLQHGKVAQSLTAEIQSKSQLRINLCFHYHKMPCAGLCLAPDVDIQDHFTSQNDSSAFE